MIVESSREPYAKHTRQWLIKQSGITYEHEKWQHINNVELVLNTFFLHAIFVQFKHHHQATQCKPVMG